MLWGNGDGVACLLNSALFRENRPVDLGLVVYPLGPTRRYLGDGARESTSCLGDIKSIALVMLTIANLCTAGNIFESGARYLVRDFDILSWQVTSRLKLDEVLHSICRRVVSSLLGRSHLTVATRIYIYLYCVTELNLTCFLRKLRLELKVKGCPT